MTRFIAQIALLLLVALFTWRAGEWPERCAAGVFLGMLAVDQAFHAALGAAPYYRGLDVWHLALDGLGFAIVLVIALKADRLWTLWLAATQLVAVLSHLPVVVESRFNPEAYAILNRSPVWLAIMIVGWGTVNVARRRTNARTT